jgi:hypothetical protein
MEKWWVDSSAEKRQDNEWLQQLLPSSTMHPYFFQKTMYPYQILQYNRTTRGLDKP